MPLSMVQKGKSVVLKEITWSDKLKRKLNEMGLTPGVKFDIVNNIAGGCMVIDVRGTRLALGQGLVSKIIVDELR